MPSSSNVSRSSFFERADSFSSLANAADDLEFSNNGGASWTYAPTADANGVDATVTHIRVRPKGSMVPGSSFTINLRGLVK